MRAGRRQSIGPQSLSLNGRDIELSNIPTPAAPTSIRSEFIATPSANPTNFYLDTTLSAGTSTYIDSATDASIAGNAQVNLDGPGISSGTLLTNLVQRDGSTYTQPFQNATQLQYTGTKGGATLATQTLNVTCTTTVQDLIDFVDQASGIQPTSADSQNPLPGNPGGSVDTANSSIQFVSNNGDPNAVSIGLSALQVVTPTGTQSVNLNFNSTQNAVGTGASTNVVVYDSLGDPLNVTINTVLQSTSATGTVYRWFADSSENQPVTGDSIAVGTGEIEFDAQGNLVNPSQLQQVSIARNGSAGCHSSSTLTSRRFRAWRSAAAAWLPARQDGSATGTLSELHDRWQRSDHRRLFQWRDARPGSIATGPVCQQPGAGAGWPEPLLGRRRLWLADRRKRRCPGYRIDRGGCPEQSNTDIGQNLINLITASTEYRSSAQIISTVQTLYETLLSLRTG